MRPGKKYILVKSLSIALLILCFSIHAIAGGSTHKSIFKQRKADTLLTIKCTLTDSVNHMPISYADAVLLYKGKIVERVYSDANGALTLTCPLNYRMDELTIKIIYNGYNYLMVHDVKEVMDILLKGFDGDDDFDYDSDYMSVIDFASIAPSTT